MRFYLCERRSAGCVRLCGLARKWHGGAVGDGYAWYEFAPIPLNDSMVFEFGSGPWERGGGIGATKEVRLDRVEISRCD